MVQKLAATHTGHIGYDDMSSEYYTMVETYAASSVAMLLSRNDAYAVVGRTPRDVPRR